MDKKQLKKIIFIILLIIFLPSAIYLLVTGKFGVFFVMALVIYGLILLLNKYLV